MQDLKLGLAALAAVVLAGGAGCGSHSSAAATPSQPAAPSFSIPSGAYSSVQTLVLSESTPGATIFYTTDGSTPTSSSAQYTGPLTIAVSETVESIAVVGGDTNSPLVSATYIINLTAAAPAFSLAAGSYGTPQSLTITSTTPGAKIYFSTDGSTPSVSSTVYSGSVPVAVSETVKAIAFATGYSASTVTSAAYVVSNLGSITGTVGSSHPIANAKVYLLTPGVTGYGMVSVSLLNANQTGHSDSLGAYLTTAADGSFSLTGQFTCALNQPLYVYASGGDPGIGTNPAIGLMAIVGGCPPPGTSISARVNEVTTVAAAYALAGFATDATDVSSSGTALAQVGVSNAFATATNLVTLSGGTALATTPAGNGTVPQPLIDTLANLLAGCVNLPSSCATLFATATSDGTSAGTAAPNTATAAINIAHHPGLNVGSLYAAATPGIYTPALGNQPRDFTMVLSFTGGGLTNMRGIAVDAHGNVWTEDYGQAISEFSPLGAPGFPNGINIQQATTYSVSTVGKPVAVDLQGDVWMVAGQGVFEVTNAGTLLSPAGGYPGGGSTSGGVLNSNDEVELAIDNDNNVWLSHSIQQTVAKLSNTGSVLSPSGGYALVGSNQPYGIAVNSSGNILVGGNAQLVTLSTAGAILSTNSNCCGLSSLALDAQGNVWSTFEGSTVNKTLPSGGTQAAAFTSQGPISDLAIDGAGNVWLPKGPGAASSSASYSPSVIEVSNASAMLSPSIAFTTSSGTATDYGFAYGQIPPPVGVAVDGSGDVWLACYTANSTTPANEMAELVGIATPVVTPIVSGSKNNALGMRP